MDAPDKWLYEYSLIRFVPRIDREEFINIGMVMMNKRRKWMRGKIWIDEPRLKMFYPGVEIEALKNQCRLFENSDVPKKDLPVEERYRWLTAVKSAVIQVSPSHPGIVATEKLCMEDVFDTPPETIMDAEFERLFTQLVR